MPTETKKEIELEIAYVLFIDIVGYSKLVTSEQHRLLELLNTIVRDSEHFRAAEAKSRLITVPTGDGMALVFYNTPEAPVECAFEVSKAASEHPELKLRMGIHSGPVSGVVDVSGRSNIAGAGINIAQRVMDCGDAGHILLSRRVADDLEHYPRWKPYLHDLGQCEVKHGVRISVVNFYTDEIGNPALPEKLKTARPIISEPQAKRSKPVFVLSIGIATLAVIALFASLVVPRIWRSNEKAKREPAEALPIPAKSIAVLPFDNLSR